MGLPDELPSWPSLVLGRWSVPAPAVMRRSQVPWLTRSTGQAPTAVLLGPAVPCPGIQSVNPTPGLDALGRPRETVRALNGTGFRRTHFGVL